MKSKSDIYLSLNESINEVQNPQIALNEAQEYASVLEDALDFVCEQLEITPEELIEMAMTAGRATEHRKAIAGAKTKAAAIKAQRQRIKERDTNKIYGRGGKVRGEDVSTNSGKVRARWFDKDKRDRKYHY